MEKSSSSIKFSCEFIYSIFTPLQWIQIQNYLQRGQVKTINSNENKSVGSLSDCSLAGAGRVTNIPITTADNDTTENGN